LVEWATTTRILDGLKTSQDAAVWQKFCDHFHPVIVIFAKHLGLSAADAEDAAQETTLAFLKAYRGGKYDRQKGRLGDWLFGIARNVILDFRKRLPRERLVADDSAGTSYWNLVEDPNTAKVSWDTHWRRMVLAACLEQVRKELDPAVFEAFRLYALEDKPVKEVAVQLTMSHNAVYIAKSRVLSRLRQLEREFEELDEKGVA
jgi:RNA polymerase sigma factor (sigma-70 family)